jgi:hypothetical protein
MLLRLVYVDWARQRGMTVTTARKGDTIAGKLTVKIMHGRKEACSGRGGD